MNNEWIENQLPAYLPKGMALSLYCCRLGGQPLVYRDHVLPSASLIKLLIMSAAFRAQCRGCLDFSASCTVTDPVEGGSFYRRGGEAVTAGELIRQMIVESDNTCANMLIQYLGMDAVNDECRRLGLRHTALRRRMMDWEAVRQGRENVTTVADMGRFFSLLACGKVVSADADRNMRDILSWQEDNCIIPAQLPHPVRVEHKTGELDGFYHDCGLVYAPSGTFILCLMAENVTNEPALFYGLSYFTRAIYDELSGNSAK